MVHDGPVAASRPPGAAKVFGIGWQKTGTKSVGRALQVLGFSVASYQFVDDPEIHDRRKLVAKAIPLMRQYDACQDNPWTILFRELDEAFPGGRFILTLREEKAWYASAVRQFAGAPSEMLKLLYGEAGPVGHETLFIERYRRHNREVMSYFAHRPNDLLVMDLAAGDGWEKLCPFLGVSIPAAPFPRENVAGTPRRSAFQRASRFVKRALRRDA